MYVESVLDSRTSLYRKKIAVMSSPTRVKPTPKTLYIYVTCRGLVQKIEEPINKSETTCLF